VSLLSPAQKRASADVEVSMLSRLLQRAWWASPCIFFISQNHYHRQFRTGNHNLDCHIDSHQQKVKTTLMKAFNFSPMNGKNGGDEGFQTIYDELSVVVYYFPLFHFFSCLIYALE
jgi:hypothetical protein